MSELSASAIRAAVGRCAIGAMVLVVDEVESTNDTATQLARMDAPHGSVVVARAQRAGNGGR